MQSNETEREEPRDYEQYIHWQLVALLRGLRLSINLTPAQEQLIRSRAQLIATTINEDFANKTLQARIQGAEMLADMVNAAVIDGKQSHSVSVIQKIVNRELAELQSQLPKKERTE